MCASCGEPGFWLRINVSSIDEYTTDNEFEDEEVTEKQLAMARVAVDRSNGLCESFHGPADSHFLAFLADR